MVRSWLAYVDAIHFFLQLWLAEGDLVFFLLEVVNPGLVMLLYIRPFLARSHHARVSQRFLHSLVDAG